MPAASDPLVLEEKSTNETDTCPGVNRPATMITAIGISLTANVTDWT